jgi:hypothetical protein
MKPNEEKYITALAKINEKLDVLQKSMKPVSDDDGGRNTCFSSSQIVL